MFLTASVWHDIITVFTETMITKTPSDSYFTKQLSVHYC